jgi:hypothetical protein
MSYMHIKLYNYWWNKVSLISIANFIVKENIDTINNVFLNGWKLNQDVHNATIH